MWLYIYAGQISYVARDSYLFEMVFLPSTVQWIL